MQSISDDEYAYISCFVFIITINGYWYDSFAMSIVIYVRFRACLQLVIIIYNGVK